MHGEGVHQGHRPPHRVTHTQRETHLNFSLTCTLVHTLVSVSYRYMSQKNLELPGWGVAGLVVPCRLHRRPCKPSTYALRTAHDRPTPLARHAWHWPLTPSCRRPRRCSGPSWRRCGPPAAALLAPHRACRLDRGASSVAPRPPRPLVPLPSPSCQGRAMRSVRIPWHTRAWLWGVLLKRTPSCSRRQGRKQPMPKAVRLTLPAAAGAALYTKRGARRDTRAAPAAPGHPSAITDCRRKKEVTSVRGQRQEWHRARGSRCARCALPTPPTCATHPHSQ